MISLLYYYDGKNLILFHSFGKIWYNQVKMPELRKQIREAIIATGKGDPQDNFTILSENKKDGKYKISILWSKDNVEILEINI